MNQYNKKIIKELLTFLINAVIAECGDGDALWYAKFAKIDEISALLIEEQIMPKNWTIQKQTEDELIIGEHQEGIRITKNKNIFDKELNSCFYECKVIY